MELIRPLLEVVGAATVIYWMGQALWQGFASYQIRRDAKRRLDQL